MSVLSPHPSSTTEALRGISRLPAPHRFLIACGLLLLASAAFHGVVFLVSGASWDGPVSWRKPILFGFSFGITAATVGLIASMIRMRTGVAWALLGALGVASVAETGLITMQTWRGVPSHFNLATEFDSAVFSAMGSVVAVVALSLAVLAILTFTSLRADSPSLAWAIRAGIHRAGNARPRHPRVRGRDNRHRAGRRPVGGSGCFSGQALAAEIVNIGNGVVPSAYGAPGTRPAAASHRPAAARPRPVL